MKIYCARLSHETNKFSPIPTNLDSFREGFLYRPSTGEGEKELEHLKTGDNIAGIAAKRGHEVFIGLAADAQPSARVIQSDYEELRDELLNNLKTAGPFDAVILFLHGAMVAFGYEDCEGDTLEKIRNIVGPDIPIGVELDLHANVSQKMVDNADVLMACKEYPHTDFPDRARDLVVLIERICAGECRPTMAFQPIPLTGIFSTTKGPMRKLVDDTMAMEQEEDVLSISLTHGFTSADHGGVGGSAIVVTQNDMEKADALARDLSARFFSIRDDIRAPVVHMDTALDRLSNEPCGGPVIIADISDNPGGGAAGDSTYLLRALLDRGVTNAAVGMIWDPIAVEFALKAGVGAKIPLRIGGKSGTYSGDPIDLEAEVIGATNSQWQWAMGMRETLGRAAAIQAWGIQIVLCSTRQQVLSPECFTSVGVEVADKSVVVVKSAEHFFATFKDILSDVIYAVPSGGGDDYMSLYDFTNLPTPSWPFDTPPFSAFGRTWT